MTLSVYITCKNSREAEKISKFLLAKRLVACANMFPVKSSYWWKGKIADENEYAIVAKTRKENKKKLVSAVKKIHSYSVPCIVFWPIAGGSKDFLKWVKKQT